MYRCIDAHFYRSTHLTPYDVELAGFELEAVVVVNLFFLMYKGVTIYNTTQYYMHCP